MPSDQQSGAALGDYGGGVSARRVSLEHTRMIERAIREKWPIRDEDRLPLIMRQVRISLDEKNSPRESTSAFKSVLLAERQNMEAEALALEIAGVKRGEAGHVTNQQINIYVPSNGRGPAGIPKISINGNGNGHTNGVCDEGH